MKSIIILVWTLLLALPAAAAGAEQQLTEIRQRWAQIQYELAEERREEAFGALAERTASLTEQHPQQAGVFIWHGIVLSSQAREQGGTGALGLVREARGALETALELDPDALDGAAYTTLGSLYYQVPGWPLAFGDDEQAEEYLREALRINPEGLDANYFYGDFLLEQGETERARSYLENVLNAPDREGSPVADAGRRREARELLESINSPAP